MTPIVWDGADEFYAADERREHSREAKLPGRYFGESWGESYDAYWLEQTGELIAICVGAVPAGDPLAAARDRPTHQPVELLGWAESEQAAIRTLGGWASQQMKLKSLYWLRKRIALSDTPSVPPDQVTARHRDKAAEDAGSLF